MQTPGVRPPAVAGTWYPGTGPELRKTITAFLEQVQPAVLPGRPLALISPHAGYAYSGPIAARAYAQVRGSSFRRVVLLGPLHRPLSGSRLGSFMVSTESAYRTPLGEVPLDRAFITQLDQYVDITPVWDDQEHALEIELPFLQIALADFTLVPILIGEHITGTRTLERLQGLAQALIKQWDEATLLVISTDLSHLNDYAEVVRTDTRLVALVEQFNVDTLAHALHTEQVQACGAAALVVGCRVAQGLGARGAQVLGYATSGDITGNKRPGTYTVGYMAAAIYV